MMKSSRRRKAAKQKGSRRRSGYQIFVSHATADKWIARVICEKLEAVGASTFRDDRDIQGGDDIPDEIRHQIKRSREVVVLLTPQSVGRQWVLLEIGAAWGWSKNIRINVILYHIDIAPVPEILKSKKVVSLNDIDQLLTEIQRRIEKFGN